MKRPDNIWKLLLSLALTATAACGHDDSVSIPEEAEDNPYVLLRINLPSGTPLTRSNPAGGEEGNGREEGILNEENIHDINVFFYDDEKGLDGNSDTPIISHIFFNLDDYKDEHNTPLKAYLKPETQAGTFSSSYLELSFSLSVNTGSMKDGVKFAAIANIGYLGNDITTLGDLRDLDFSAYNKNAWSSTDLFSRNAKEMDYFLMSTGFNQEYFYEGKSTGTNEIKSSGEIFKGTTTLERLYGRMDLWYNAVNNAGISKDAAPDAAISRLVYDVTDSKDAATGNKVYLLNILPVNVMQAPSYLFKKVTDSPDPSPEWTSTYIKSLTKFNWGGKETPSNLPTAIPGADDDFTDLPTNYVMERHTTEKTSTGVGDITSWYGSTVLSSVKKDIASGDKGRISGYYNVKREKGLYDPDYNCDRISIISYANENTHPVDCFHPNYMTGLAIKALYVPLHIYKEYSPASAESSESLVELSDDDRKNFNLSNPIYRYSPSKDREVEEKASLYFSTLDALEGYKQAHPGDNAITTLYYPDREEELFGLICYYNLWIRHYNDEQADPQKNYPMEYAIVRNNIYRVALFFKGPGEPEPTMRQPDTMMSRIFVRKWNQRVEKNPLQF